MEKYLEFKNVKKSFPGVMALKGVSFRADAGRVMALLGENGAGKSTLLKVMSGDLQPEEGEIIISGESKKDVYKRQPKENFLRIARKEKPLWIPNVSAEFNSIQPQVMPDASARCHGGTDWFGIEWEYEPRSNAAMVKPGTRRLSDITKWREELVWPDLKEIDWAKDYEETYAPFMEPDRATNFAIVNGCFERLGDLTSFADCLMYLIEEEEEVTALFSRFTDFHIELMEVARKYYGADLITFHDDMGTQISTFMSVSYTHLEPDAGRYLSSAVKTHEKQ